MARLTHLHRSVWTMFHLPPAAGPVASDAMTTVRQTQHVVGVAEFGGPEQLDAHEVPVPVPGPGETRIRVAAAAVSPTDTHLRAGTYGTYGQQPPYVPGMDAAGIVDAVGEGVPWQVGQRLMAIALPTGPHGGAYVQHLVGPWQSMTPVPDSVSLVEASTVPMNGLTALQALAHLDLSAGSTLAVTGAAGTLGSYLVRLARAAGLVVVADTAEKDRELVTSLGPEHVVERGPDVARAIRGVFPEGVDGLVDASVQGEQIVPALRDGGRLATVRFWEGPDERGIETFPVRVRDEYLAAERLEQLATYAEDGTLPLSVAAELPCTRAAQAHRMLEAGGVRGRIVLTF